MASQVQESQESSFNRKPLEDGLEFLLNVKRRRKANDIHHAQSISSDFTQLTKALSSELDNDDGVFLQHFDPAASSRLDIETMFVEASKTAIPGAIIVLFNCLTRKLTRPLSTIECLQSMQTAFPEHRAVDLTAESCIRLIINISQRKFNSVDSNTSSSERHLDLFFGLLISVLKNNLPQVVCRVFSANVIRQVLNTSCSRFLSHCTNLDDFEQFKVTLCISNLASIMDVQLPRKLDVAQQALDVLVLMGGIPAKSKCRPDSSPSESKREHSKHCVEVNWNASLNKLCKTISSSRFTYAFRKFIDTFPAHLLNGSSEEDTPIFIQFCSIYFLSSPTHSKWLLAEVDKCFHVQYIQESNEREVDQLTKPKVALRVMQLVFRKTTNNKQRLASTRTVHVIDIDDEHVASDYQDWLTTTLCGGQYATGSQRYNHARIGLVATALLELLPSDELHLAKIQYKCLQLALQGTKLDKRRAPGIASTDSSLATAVEAVATYRAVLQSRLKSQSTTNHSIHVNTLNETNTSGSNEAQKRLEQFLAEFKTTERAPHALMRQYQMLHRIEFQSQFIPLLLSPEQGEQGDLKHQLVLALVRTRPPLFSQTELDRYMRQREIEDLIRKKHTERVASSAVSDTHTQTLTWMDKLTSLFLDVIPVQFASRVLASQIAAQAHSAVEGSSGVPYDSKSEEAWDAALELLATNIVLQGSNRIRLTGTQVGDFLVACVVKCDHELYSAYLNGLRKGERHILLSGVHNIEAFKLVRQIVRRMIVVDTSPSDKLVSNVFCVTMTQLHTLDPSNVEILQSAAVALYASILETKHQSGIADVVKELSEVCLTSVGSPRATVGVLILSSCFLSLETILGDSPPEMESFWRRLWFIWNSYNTDLHEGYMMSQFQTSCLNELTIRIQVMASKCFRHPMVTMFKQSNCNNTILAECLTVEKSFAVNATRYVGVSFGEQSMCVVVSSKKVVAFIREHFDVSETSLFALVEYIIQHMLHNTEPRANDCTAGIHQPWRTFGTVEQTCSFYSHVLNLLLFGEAIRGSHDSKAKANSIQVSNKLLCCVFRLGEQYFLKEQQGCDECRAVHIAIVTTVLIRGLQLQTHPEECNEKLRNSCVRFFNTLFRSPEQKAMVSLEFRRILLERVGLKAPELFN